MCLPSAPRNAQNNGTKAVQQPEALEMTRPEGQGVRSQALTSAETSTLASLARASVSCIARSLAILLITVCPLVSQDPTPDDWDLASQLIKALRQSDARTLGQLTDFSARMAEEIARGKSRRTWETMDELDRVVASAETTDLWLGAEPRHFESGTLYNIRLLEDPDAGWGPVSNRRIIQVVVKSARSGQLLDMVIVATPDGMALDLRFGSLYAQGFNPLGEEGLQPEGRPNLKDQRVHWPSELDQFDLEEATELVDQLLNDPNPRERKRVVEFLHRNPRAAVAELLERVLELDEADSPDRIQQRSLIDALETITGRTSSFVAIPRFKQDEGSIDALNAAAIETWLRWQQRHGATFVAAPVDSPLVPTHRERPLASSSEAKDKDSGETAAGAALAPPRSRPSPATTPPKPTPSASPEEGASRTPTVVIRKINRPRATRAPLKDQAASLQILWGDREVTAGEVADQIPASVRRVLDAWAEAIITLDLRVCLSGNPDHVVLGRAPDAVLIEAAKSMDQAWELLDPRLPQLTKRTARPVLSILFDQQAQNDGAFWNNLLDELQRKRALTETDVERLARDPNGVMVRNVPMFLQPTYDQAGNAAAGDDEFRASNEIVHKFAQCLLTQRAGQMPESIRWGIGHLAENEIRQSVYQFNTTGFVATGDHFGWANRAHRLLEKAAKKRKFSAPEVLLGIGNRAGDTDAAVMVWGLMAGVLSWNSAQFSAMLEALAEVHADQDPYGVAEYYQGDESAAVAALELRLAELDMKEILAQLEAMR
jgi:hypothetical protein